MLGLHPTLPPEFVKFLVVVDFLDVFGLCFAFIIYELSFVVWVVILDVTKNVIYFFIVSFDLV